MTSAQYWICWFAASGPTALCCLAFWSLPGNALHMKQAHIDQPNHRERSKLPPRLLGMTSNVHSFSNPMWLMSHSHNSWVQSSLKTDLKKEVLNWKASKLTTCECVGCICFPTYQVFRACSLSFFHSTSVEAGTGYKTNSSGWEDSRVYCSKGNTPDTGQH